jgi:formyltetrahydrofolate deformylase
MRLAFELGHMEQRRLELTARFEPLATRFGMDWSLTQIERRKRVAVFVSREDHCLLELLWRQQSGDLDADIAMVISNHADLRGIVEARGIAFHHTPMTAENKLEAEARQLVLMEGDVDLVVLARYMQILSPGFVAAWPNRVINIHHGLLPAFVGASPYRQAHARGVKLIGATAHYVTPQLDAGPIIEQDVERVDHDHGVDELRRIGRYIERVVLARAVQWHVEDRVLVDGERTVVFPS